jgi:hypothetical protein
VCKVLKDLQVHLVFRVCKELLLVQQGFKVIKVFRVLKV